MTILQAIILGIIQGFTEFLPISSSGHLVILPYLLGWEIPEEQIFPFDVLVQLGTLVAVIIYFRKDIVDIFKAIVVDFKVRKLGSSTNSRLGWFLVLATLPAGIAGLFLKDVVEQAFESPTAVTPHSNTADETSSSDIGTLKSSSWYTCCRCMIMF